VSVRICPHCGRQVPTTLVAAYGDALECPHCHTTLRVSDGSRVIGAFLALAAGLLVWELTRGPSDGLAWLLPEIYAFLSYSLVFCLYVMAAADLVIRPADTAEETVTAGGSTVHGAHH
jgi:ribosomal protein S27AE